MFDQLLGNGLIQGAEIALLAVGFSLLYTASRFFAFTYGASVVSAAYSFLLLSRVLPLVISVLLAMLVGVAVGLSLERGIYQRLRERGRGPLVLMLASIGAYVLFQNVISMVFGDATRLIHGHGGWHSISYTWLGVRFAGTQILVAVISPLAIILASALLHWSRLGAKCRAVANDGPLASTVGIDINGVIAVGVALGSAIASLAAVLISLDLGLTPTMGFQALLLGVVAAVVGGVGSIGGSVVAGIVLGLLQQLAVWRLPSQWQDAVVFAALIVVLVVRPQGLLGKNLAKAGS